MAGLWKGGDSLLGSSASIKRETMAFPTLFYLLALLLLLVFSGAGDFGGRPTEAFTTKCHEAKTEEAEALGFRNIHQTP